MSGGHFNYFQYRIKDIADSIELELDRQGKEKSEENIFDSQDFLEKYPEERFYCTYSEAVQEKMREAVKQLRLAAVYVQRVDWFLSGDDGEESFIERLEEELSDLTKQKGQD